MRVLVIKASAMGDIIHALPVLDYLRHVAPAIEIDWVVEEPFVIFWKATRPSRNSTW